MLALLPAVPFVALIVVAIWFLWPIVVDPIVRASDPARRHLRRDVDKTAEHLFDSWAHRG